MAQTNHYSYGRAWESVGYTTNGEADDWGWASEGIPSWTVEVGTSKDSFWPAPSRIGTIAQENVWAARTLAWAAGPQLQLDSVSVRPVDASGKNVEVSLVWQNNGLEDFSAGHTICVPAVGGGMKAKASAGWTLPPAKDKLCHSLQALPKRTSHALPPLTVTVDGAATSHLEFVFAVELQASPKFAWTMVLRVRNEARTYKECDELCICPSDEALAMEYSHECRARVPEGSNCRTAKEAHTGSNWASGAHTRATLTPCRRRLTRSPVRAGVIDEFFHWTPTLYASGGRCSVGTKHREALIGVYGTCGRFGGQEALAFANSERGYAEVTFPCTAGHTYYLFWNAEYLPGRFSFNVGEACSASSCHRAHRKRSRLMFLRRRR